MTRINPITGRIILPRSDARPGRYQSARVSDCRAQFTLRLHDYRRASSPRAQRLRREREHLIASHRQFVEDLEGGIAFLILIIILAAIS